MFWVACAIGKKPPKFKDHTSYLYEEMEDLLKLNEVASAIKTEIIPLRSNKTELSDHFMNLRLAARFKTSLSSYVKYNLQILGISSYNSDQVTLVAEDNTTFSREVPLTTGTKTEDQSSRH